MHGNSSLLECNTGFVYLIASANRPSFIYIGEYHSIIDQLRAHNSGNGSESTTPIRLRPLRLLAYICGFDRNKTLRCHIERQWKYETQRQLQRGVNDAKQVAYSRGAVVEQHNTTDDLIVQSQ